MRTILPGVLLVAAFLAAALLCSCGRNTGATGSGDNPNSPFKKASPEEKAARFGEEPHYKKELTPEGADLPAWELYDAFGSRIWVEYEYPDGKERHFFDPAGEISWKARRYFDEAGRLVREEFDRLESGFEWRYYDSTGSAVNRFDYDANRDGKIDRVKVPAEDGSEIEEIDTDRDGVLDTRIYRDANKFETLREKIE